MIVQRTRGIRTLVALVQAAGISVTFWASFLALTQMVPGSDIFALKYMGYWLAVLLGLMLEMALRGTEDYTGPLYASSLVRHLPVALRQMVFALGGLLLLLVVTKDLAISRRFLSVFAVLTYPVLLWTNATVPSRLARMLFRGNRQNDTLLVGPAERVPGLLNWLTRKELLGVRLSGLVLTEDSACEPEGGLKVLGQVGQFEQIVSDGTVSQVILLELPKPEIARALIDVCEQRGIRMIFVNDFAEKIHRPIVSLVDEGVNVLTLFEEPLENPLNRVLKRTLDLAIAIPVVLLVLPELWLLVAFIQLCQSRGPVLHRQKRAGLQNKVFTIFKFRTMHVANGGEEKQATADDERVYPMARWLRRFSIDEFPQFLNVLRGEMSVVGPRPHLVEHNRQFSEVLAGYHVRTFIKPGITGLAQVRGFRGEARTRQDIAARLQSDLVYMENWSLSLDLVIIARTLWQMVRPPRSAV